MALNRQGQDERLMRNREFPVPMMGKQILEESLLKTIQRE
jgi:hypothetical protein